MTTIKRYLSFLSVCTLLLSCGTNFEEIERRILSGDYDAYEELPYCECGDLQLNNNKQFTLDGTAPFSGTCKRFYPETTITMEERQLLKGIYNGYFSIFNMDGQLLTRTLYKNGSILSAKGEDALKCNCKDLSDFTDSLSQTELKLFNGTFFTGTCENFYADSTIALRAEYIEGRLHGELTVFSTQGDEILKEKYDSGKLIE